MKYFYLFYTVLLSITLHSCNNNRTNKQTINKIIDNESIAPTTHSDSIIDLSLETLMEIQANSYNGKPSKKEDLVKYAAATARFYGNLDIIDKRLTSKSKTGKEIGLNEDVFTFYNEGIKQLNLEIENMDNYSTEQLKKDIETQVSQLLLDIKK